MKLSAGRHCIPRGSEEKINNFKEQIDRFANEILHFKLLLATRAIDIFSAFLYMLLMAQMNISLPDGLKNWAEARVAEGRYSSTSDLVRDLLRREQDYVTKLERLQAAIDEGLASPPTGGSVEEIIEQGFARLA